MTKVEEPGPDDSQLLLNFELTSNCSYYPSGYFTFIPTFPKK